MWPWDTSSAEKKQADGDAQAPRSGGTQSAMHPAPPSSMLRAAQGTKAQKKGKSKGGQRDQSKVVSIKLDSELQTSVQAAAENATKLSSTEEAVVKERRLSVHIHEPFALKEAADKKIAELQAKFGEESSEKSQKEKALKHKHEQAQKKVDEVSKKKTEELARKTADEAKQKDEEEKALKAKDEKKMKAAVEAKKKAEEERQDKAEKEGNEKKKREVALKAAAKRRIEEEQEAKTEKRKAMEVSAEMATKKSEEQHKKAEEEGKDPDEARCFCSVPVEVTKMAAALQMTVAQEDKEHFSKAVNMDDAASSYQSFLRRLSGDR